MEQQVEIDQNIEKTYRSSRINTGGNYCGHDPLSPRFYKTDVPNRPKFIEKSKEQMKKFYYQPYSHFELNSANEILKRKKEIKQKKKITIIIKISQTRSERREADILVMNYMLDRMDIVTRKVFNNPSITDIAKALNIKFKRADRAIKDLIAAGYIYLQQKKEINVEGKWRSKNAIKTISLKVFNILGVSAWYGYERERKIGNSKKRKRTNKTSFAHVEKIANSIAQSFDSGILEQKSTLAYIENLRLIIEPKPEPDWTEQFETEIPF